MRSKFAKFKSTHWPIPLLLGLVLRLWLLYHHPHANGDTLVYGDIAKNILQHHIYGFTDGNTADPTLIRLPGYPAFVALCFALFGVENYFYVSLTQIFMDLAACLLLAACARRLFGTRAATAALWLSSLCVLTATYIVIPLAEPPSLFCIAWATCALIRFRDAFVENKKRIATLHLFSLSLAMLFALMLRPDNGLLAAAFVPAVFYITWRHAGLQRAIAGVALCTAIFLAAIIPWTIRNYTVMGVFQPLAPRNANDPGEFVTVGFDRWYTTWAIDYASTEEVYWAPQTTPIDINNLPTRAFNSPDQRARTAALINEYNQGPFDSPELDAKFNSLAIERIHQHPIQCHILLPLARLINMWLRPRVEQFDFDLRWWRYSDHPQQTLIALALGALNLFYLVLAKLGWWRIRASLFTAGPQAAVLWAITAFVILRCLLLLTIDNSEPRYTIECFPIIFLFAAANFTPVPHSSQPHRDQWDTMRLQ